MVKLTHPDKVLFPKSKITKEDLAKYYLVAASKMLPLIKDRPISMQKFPKGIKGGEFFQKEAPKTLPVGVKTTSVKAKTRSAFRMILCQNKSTLTWLANQNSITQHIWLSRVDKPDMPDRMIFDLDPSTEGGFQSAVEGALLLKEVLEKEAKLRCYVSTTGSRGLHVTVPIKRAYHFDDVREFAKKIAEKIVTMNPKKFTTEMRKEKRRGKVYIDIYRNGYGQTVVAPYSVRAKEGAPIAAPLFWLELKNKKLRSDSFTILDIKERVKKNPWAGINRLQSLRLL